MRTEGYFTYIRKRTLVLHSLNFLLFQDLTYPIFILYVYNELTGTTTLYLGPMGFHLLSPWLDGTRGQPCKLVDTTVGDVLDMLITTLITTRCVLHCSNLSIKRKLLPLPLIYLLCRPR